MIDRTEECVQLLDELRAVLQRLALVSHAPIQGYNFAPPEFKAGERWRVRDTKPPNAHLGAHHAKGGDTSIPRGKIDWRGDKTPEYRQKSAEHFARTIDRWQESKASYTASDLRSLLKDARATAEAWAKTPTVAGVDPERESFRWKCTIADDPRSSKDIQRVYGVSRSTVTRYRAQFQGVLQTIWTSD